MLECLFKNVTGLKTCKFIKKRPEHRCFSVNIAKFLISNSKNNYERLFFLLFQWFTVTSALKVQGLDCMTASRFRAQLTALAFLFLSWYEPSLSPRPAFENLRRIPLMNQLSFYIGYFWLF